MNHLVKMVEDILRNEIIDPYICDEALLAREIVAAFHAAIVELDRSHDLTEWIEELQTYPNRNARQEPQ